MADSTTRAGGLTAPGAGGWVEHQGNAFRAPVSVGPSPTGHRAEALTLPGVSAEGATEAEALENIKGALASTVTQHKAAGRPIPWKEAAQPSPGTTVRWVFFYLK